MRKQMGKVLGILITISIIPVIAFADSSDYSEMPYKFGQPIFKGSGCPDADSIAFVTSPDGSELSLLFGNFTVTTSSTISFDFARCKIEVPIDVSEGIKVSVLRVDHRGIADIPEGGEGVFTREYSIAGKNDRRFSRPIKKKDKLYELFYNILYEDASEVVAISKCGEDIVARANATLMVKNPTSGSGNAVMSLFSEDWILQWAECEEEDR